jgi:rod shape-determining protein MreC
VVFEYSSRESTRPVPVPPPDGPSVPAFIGRHQSFFVLLAVVTAQLLLLSLQITRNHHVRLIRYWAVEIFDPLERSLGGLTRVSFNAYRTYRHLWYAEQENQELYRQLMTAQEQIQRLSEQAGETQRLRNLLEFKNQLAYQTVAAEVIASSPGENSNAIFIDKGSDAGLTNDLAVITSQGVVGKILAVFPHSAQVLLITDPSSGVGVTLSDSRVQGILKGGTNSTCNLRYVMNEEAVNRGEAVVTSGLDQVYPKGLAVGLVVGAGNGNIYKNISVKPSVDLNRLEVVLVVLKPAAALQQAFTGPLRPK